MKRKIVLGLLLSTVMLAGCSATKVEPPFSISYEEVETEGTEDDTTGKTLMSFENGKSFYTSQVYEKSGESYKSENGKSFVTLSIYSDVATCVTELSDRISEETGDSPMEDEQPEGTYLTGFAGDSLILAFTTPGTNGKAYTILLRTSDTNNSVKTMKSLSNDLCKSDLAVYNIETGELREVIPEVDEVIEEPVVEVEELVPYWTESTKYPAIYNGRGCVVYGDSKYSVICYYKMESDVLGVVKGTGSSIQKGVYSECKVSDLKVASYPCKLIEGKSTSGLYCYWLVNEEKGFCIKFHSVQESQIKSRDINNLLKEFIK